mgnify:CR=1 FL=1
MQHARAVIITTLALFAQPALSDVKAPGGKTIDCYCTDKSGSRVELGETICLQVDGRMFMAQCQMSLNVPMWREVSQGCLSSSLEKTPSEFSTVTSFPQL